MNKVLVEGCGWSAKHPAAVAPTALRTRCLDRQHHLRSGASTRSSPNRTSVGTRRPVLSTSRRSCVPHCVRIHRPSDTSGWLLLGLPASFTCWAWGPAGPHCGWPWVPGPIGVSWPGDCVFCHGRRMCPAFPATPPVMWGRRRPAMSSVGSGLAVRTGRFQGMTEETEDSASTGNYLWLGVWRRDLPTNLDVFLAFLAPTAPRAKYGGVRHRSRFPAIKNYARRRTNAPSAGPAERRRIRQNVSSLRRQ
jgi:hypothetical protein